MSAFFKWDPTAYPPHHDIVYPQPAVRCDDYLPIGNGDLGALIDPFGLRLV